MKHPPARKWAGWRFSKLLWGLELLYSSRQAFDLRLCVGEAGEPVLRTALPSERGIEALDVRVVGRSAHVATVPGGYAPSAVGTGGTYPSRTHYEQELTVELPHPLDVAPRIGTRGQRHAWCYPTHPHPWPSSSLRAGATTNPAGKPPNPGRFTHHLLTTTRTILLELLMSASLRMVGGCRSALPE